jgi:hypothetical protein
MTHTPHDPADGGIIRHRNPVNQSGFTMIPNVVLTAEWLSPPARLLFALLKMHAWQADSSYPGHKRLADYIGCSLRSVYSYQVELERARLITVERRGLRQTNMYWIEDPADAVFCRSDRQLASDLDRQLASDLDRQLASDKEYTDVKNTQLEEYDHPSGTNAPDGASEFETVWTSYPKRNGKRLEKQRAIAAYNRMSKSDRAALPAAIANYAASDQIPRDMFRFLARDYWREWLTPASAPPARRPGAPAPLDPGKYQTGKYAHLFNQEQSA